MANFAERDLWLEARQKTAAQKPPLMERALSLFKSVSFPGAPVKQVMGVLPSRDKVVWMPDLNKYRVRNLKAYQDAGCQAFMFRMGGPTRWVQNNWGYEIDATYRPYMEEADKLGVLDQTIGYIVHNAFEPYTVNGATGETIHTSLIDDWTSGGYMPASFIYDDEIDKCWSSTGAEIYATDSKMRDSLAENMLNTEKKFRRRVGAYGAKWCWGKTASRWAFYDTFFYQVNRPESAGGVGLQRPLIMAWYGQNMSATYQSMSEVGAALMKPTPEQVAKQLYCGIDAQAHQFTDRLKIGTDTLGVDMNISLVEASAFYAAFGLKAPGSVTPPPPPPPIVINTDVKELTLRVDALAAEVATLKDNSHPAAHKHETGQPV